MVQDINSFSEFQELISGDKVIAIDLYAEWCGPCKIISPTFEALAQRLEGNPNIEFYKVDIDVQPQIAEELGVRSIPTFVLFKEGNKVGELIGANKVALENLIQTNSV